MDNLTPTSFPTQSLEAALSYGRRGWSVFPCHPKAKEPLTEHGFHDATTNDQQIDAWWTKYPDANVAIATGKVSGIVAVDIDGVDGNQALQDLGGCAQPTLISITANGEHWLFRCPDQAVRCRTRFARDLDCRGDGGYIVVAPSMHPSGQRYRWENWGEEPIELPPKLLEAIVGNAKGPAPPLPDPISEGERNATLASFAGSMRRRGASLDSILAALQVENRRCDPPLMDDELEQIAVSISRYPPYDNATKETKESKGEALNAYVSYVAPSQSRSWPEPLAKAAYHRLVGEIVGEIEPQSEADPAAVVLQLLVSFGSAVGRGPYFKVEADRHHTNENGLLVGPTAKGRKGTSWSYPREIISQADPTWTWRGGLSSGEGLIWAVRDPIERQVKGEPQVIDPGVDDKRLQIMESEFASAIQVMARAGNTLSPILRLGWDGSPVLETLTKNSPARATEAHISVLGHITARELMSRLDRTELANGFANRFLIIAVRRSKVLPEGGHISDGNITLMAETVETVLKFARRVRRVTWDDDARARWYEIYPELSAGRTGLFGAIVSRAEAHVVRLGMLYALFDESSVIRLPHLEAGLALWHYAERSAEYLFGNTFGNPDADLVLRTLRQKSRLDRTQVRDLFNRHKTENELDALRATLATEGLIRVSAEPTGGRPREIWELIA